MERTLQYPNCFVCGQESKNGLRVSFQVTDEGARAEFTPSEEFEGFKGIVHGGILCALMDEAMWKTINGIAGALTLTAKMEVSFKRPAHVGNLLIIEGFITDRKRRLFETRAVISDTDGITVAEATGVFIEPNKGAREEMSENLTY